MKKPNHNHPKKYHDGLVDAWAAVGVIAIAVTAIVYYLANMP